MSNESASETNAGRAFRRYALLGAFALCVLALAIGGRLTWSAYTGNAYVKGVEVTNATQSLFASDMLVGYYSDPTADGSTTSLDSRSVVVSTDSTDSTCSFTFKIYNCLLDDQNVVNDKDVPYALSVTASGASGTDSWSIAVDGGTATSATGNATQSLSSVKLLGLSPTIKTYTVTFPESALGLINFTVKAAVDISDTSSTANVGTKLNCLAAKIVPNKASSVQAASVSGELVDKSGKFADYHAYNYRITVTGADTKVKLTWDSSVVELDPYFGTNHAGADLGTAGTAIFTMQPGSTVVNFYRVSTASPTSWDNLGIKVEQAK